MRTTLDIEDRLFRALKRKAAEERTTLRRLVNELLRRELAQSARRTRYRFDRKVCPRGPIQPGVRLKDRKSLFDRRDGGWRRPPRTRS